MSSHSLAHVPRPPDRPRGRRLAAAGRVLVCVVVAALALSVTGCGVTRGDEDEPGNRRLRMMIPNSPGGGYDQTGRAAVHVMETEELTGRFEVTNVIGASGSVAMQRLLNEEGADDLMMTIGLGVVGAVYTNDSDARITDATPLAKLIEEQEGLLVPADSPFRTVQDLIDAWKADPSSVTIGGGSTAGGPDHLFPMQLAEAVGIDPTDVRFISYDGGGPLTAALLGSKIDVGTSGLSEFEGQIEDGSLRVLATSGAEPLDTVDAPTLREAGVDLVFTNWRGVFAAPGISDATRDQMIDLLTEMHGTEAWQEQLETNGWIDAFTTGDDFAAFLEDQEDRVETTLKELGLV